MVRITSFGYENVQYWRLSVYRLGRNVQTVYAYWMDGILIDTGQRHNGGNIFHALEEKPLDKILLTHHHEDHSGNVAYLMKKRQVSAYIHRLGYEKLKKGLNLSPLALMLSGGVKKVELEVLEEQPFFSRNLQIFPIYSPGHSDDHYCYHIPEKGYLFSGDLYVADKIKYFADFEDLGTQIKSLERLVKLDFDTLFCAHNPKVKQGKERLTAKLNNFRHFYGAVEKLYHKGYSTSAIMKELQIVESSFYKYVTFGNFCAENMVKSVVKDLKLNPRV